MTEAEALEDVQRHIVSGKKQILAKSCNARQRSSPRHHRGARPDGTRADYRR
jgi:hypothetical protein